MRRNDNFAGLASRLTDELKSHIAVLKIIPYKGGGLAERRLRCETVARLHRVACIVEGERALRVQSMAQAKELVDGASGGSSLWENGEELALRFLVEGAKVNLLLRLAEDHVDGLLRSRVEDAVEEPEAEAAASAESLSSFSSSSSSSSTTTSSAAPPSRSASAPRLLPGLTPWTALEQATAVLFPSVWAHREGIQICDLALIGRVLARAMLTALALAEAAQPARPALCLMALRWLAALGGPAPVGAVGDKLVAALAASGVWALLPLFLNLAGQQAAAAAAAEGGPAEAAAAAAAGGTTTSAAGTAGAGMGGGEASSSAQVALQLQLQPAHQQLPSQPPHPAQQRLTHLDVLRGAAGACALMALESWAATVRPGLGKEAEGTVGRLVEEAGVVETEGPGAALLEAGRRAPGSPLLGERHGESLGRLKRYCLEVCLVDGGVAGGVEVGGRPPEGSGRAGASAAGKKMVRPLLDYCDWHARMAGKK